MLAIYRRLKSYRALICNLSDIGANRKALLPDGIELIYWIDSDRYTINRKQAIAQKDKIDARTQYLHSGADSFRRNATGSEFDADLAIFLSQHFFGSIASIDCEQFLQLLRSVQRMGAKSLSTIRSSAKLATTLSGSEYANPNPKIWCNWMSALDSVAIEKFNGTEFCLSLFQMMKAFEMEKSIRYFPFPNRFFDLTAIERASDSLWLLRFSEGLKWFRVRDEQWMKEIESRLWQLKEADTVKVVDVIKILDKFLTLNYLVEDRWYRTIWNWLKEESEALTYQTLLELCRIVIIQSSLRSIEAIPIELVGYIVWSLSNCPNVHLHLSRSLSIRRLHILFGDRAFSESPAVLAAIRNRPFNVEDLNVFDTRRLKNNPIFVPDAASFAARMNTEKKKCAVNVRSEVVELYSDRYGRRCNDRGVNLDVDIALLRYCGYRVKENLLRF